MVQGDTGACHVDRSCIVLMITIINSPPMHIDMIHQIYMTILLWKNGVNCILRHNADRSITVGRTGIG